MSRKTRKTHIQKTHTRTHTVTVTVTVTAGAYFTYKGLYTNTEVSRKAYGIKAGQGCQVPDVPIYVYIA
jgi:hypothetical protein